MDWWWNLLDALEAHPGQAAWAQAGITGAAVYLAATLSERSAKHADHRALRRRIAASIGLYSEARSLINELDDTFHPGQHGITASPPPQERFIDLMAALASVPVLDLPGPRAVEDLFAVKRTLSDMKIMSASAEEESPPGEAAVWVSVSDKVVEAAMAHLLSIHRR